MSTTGYIAGVTTSGGGAIVNAKVASIPGNEIFIIIGSACGAVVVLLAVALLVYRLNQRKAATSYLPAHEPRVANEDGSSLRETGNLSITEFDAFSAVGLQQMSYCSVRDVGIAFDPNPRFRREMEDEHLVIDQYGGIKSRGFFAVYDGHGGRAAVEFVKANLHVVCTNLATHELTKRIGTSQRVGKYQRYNVSDTSSLFEC